MSAVAPATDGPNAAPNKRRLITHQAALRLLLLAASALLLFVLPQQAQAGTYDVVGCQEAPPGSQHKQPFELSTNESSVAATNDCPSYIWLRGLGTMCASCAASADFHAPSGTVITGTAINHSMTLHPSDPDSYMRVTNAAGTKIAGCDPGEGGTCNVTNNLGPDYKDIADTTRILYQVGCQAGSNGCFEPLSTIPGIRITHIRIRIEDTTNPTLSGVGGSAWTSSPISGTKTVTATGSDVTGIKRSKLSVVGQADQPSWTVDYNCDPTIAAPCTSGGVGTSRSTSNSFNTTTLQDGQYTLKLTVLDTAGNPSTSAEQTINIDNTAPLPPTITEAPGVVSQFDGAHFEWRGAEPGGTYECKLDSGSWVSCATPPGKDYVGLSDGPHTFRVRQTDAAGNVGAEATYAWTIRELVADGDGDPIDSDDCTSPDATVAEGFAGVTYVDVDVATPSDEETWICMRAQNLAASVGGKFIIDTSALPGEPQVLDGTTEAGRCATEPNNLAPPAARSFPVEVGDPDAPPYAYIEFGSFTDGDEVWGCVKVTDGSQTFAKRVEFDFTGGGNPVNSVRFEPDTINPNVPDPDRLIPRPSATCATGGQTGGTYLSVFDAELADGSRAYLDAWQPSQSEAHLCVRVDGAAHVGGVFSVDSTAAPVEVERIDGMARCADPDPGGANVLNAPALDLEIRRSDATNPASICMKVGSEQHTVTAKAGNDPGEAFVRWTPDAGTPVPPIP